MAQRLDITAGWGRQLAAFTGEHVGEPRVVICLYDDPLLHVDFKFVTPRELDTRIEDPVVLWERTTEPLALASAGHLPPRRQEARESRTRFRREPAKHGRGV